MDTSNIVSRESNLSDDEDGEESGWTAYFDHFFYNKKQEEQYWVERPDKNKSMVTDAASSIIDHKKDPKIDDDPLVIRSTCLPKFSCKRTSKTREISYDDSLEDTATSPVNSPKLLQSDEKMSIGKISSEVAGEKTELYRDGETRSVLVLSVRP